MAGFFGLFDYSKPGPGVSKNGPRKKGFVRFFEIYFRKFWKLCVANLIHVLFSIPVLTQGLANAGLTFVTRNFAREKHAFVFSDFTDTIKKNWKQALPVGIINILVTFLILFNFYYYDAFGIFKAITQMFPQESVSDTVREEENTTTSSEQSAQEESEDGTSSPMFRTIMTSIMMLIWLLFSFMKYYIYMMMITFKFSLPQLYKNSLIFAFIGLWRNLGMFLLFGFIYTLLFLSFLIGMPIGIIVTFFGYIFLFPAFKSFLIQFATFPLIKKHIIDPYYKEHPDEDKEKKRALNIEDDDDGEDCEEERIFEDTDDDEEEEIEKPSSTIPRQYTQQEMDRLRNKQRSYAQEEDDDNTI